MLYLFTQFIILKSGVLINVKKIEIYQQIQNKYVILNILYLTLIYF